MDNNEKQAEKMLNQLFEDKKYFSLRAIYYAEQCAYLCSVLGRIAGNYPHIFGENFTQDDSAKIEEIRKEIHLDCLRARERCRDD